MKTRILSREEAIRYEQWTEKMTLVGNGMRLPFRRHSLHGPRPYQNDQPVYWERVLPVIKLGFAHIEVEEPEPSLKEQLGEGWLEVDPVGDALQYCVRLCKDRTLCYVVQSASGAYWGTSARGAYCSLSLLQGTLDEYAKEHGGWAK
jgi:hypothetical protein